MDYFERLQGHSEHSGKTRGRRRIVRDIIKPGETREQPSSPMNEKPGAPFAPPLPPDEIVSPTASSAPREVTPARRAEPEIPTVELDGFTPVEPTIRTWEPSAHRRARLIRRAILGGVALLLGVGFSVPTFVFPTFAVAVIPKIQSAPLVPREFSADIEATAVDIGAKRVPALLITREQTSTQEYEASGKKFIKERARGSVAIANAYSSSPQVLVANTRLQDSGGRIFRLVKAVTVPGATVADGKTVPSSVDAEVVADEVGERYNIGPAEFRIPGFRGTPKYDGFTAKSKAPMSGGYEGEARIVSADDLKRASEDLTAKVVSGLEAELDEKIPVGDDFIVPAGARQVAVTAIDAPQADEHRDRFTVRVTATGRLFALRQSQITDILRATALPDAPPGTTAVITPTQSALVLGSARANAAGKQLGFSVSGSVSYYFRSDTAEVEKIFRESSPDDAIQALLARPEVDSVRIKRFPRWLWFVPSRPGGLAITIEPVAMGVAAGS
ncbi:MAG: hypothetical protein A3A44_01880 [Candidatus Sungbacteria bacterium RIFCSPLOWO2_01_FULL_60_25]|uniref:Baseplate protein J-like domain-containing protein n=1 Tax=Candidatus Sungbacteria bacterium RIFCSPLOWO2_01_FULL_60_25 TaxID=1802281 RepID=A0A1G2LD87_9BACT|nr:MAG: hypothetical protein A3A44_01880 [Candidatus Sungbacteria bacterium RIFCSPLOWO2_01_FULL_60_25]